MEARINDVCLGMNTQDDHLLLLGEFFAVCKENHARLKLEKCEFIRRLHSIWGSALAMDGGPLRPLRSNP